jgi:hypothetical protein
MPRRCRTVVEIEVVIAQQAEAHFMNQSRGPERLAIRFAPHISGIHAAQLGIDEGNKAILRGLVLAAPGLQRECH